MRQGRSSPYGHCLAVRLLSPYTVQRRRSVQTVKHKELHGDEADLIACEPETAFSSEKPHPQPSIESSENYYPMSSQAIIISSRTMDQTFAENECGKSHILPKSGRKRPGSLGVSSLRPIKRRQALCAQSFRRSPSPKKYRVSSSLWSPYAEEQSTGHSFPPLDNLFLARSTVCTLRDRLEQPLHYGRKSWEEINITRVQGPSLQVLPTKWEGYTGAKGEGVRSCADGANHDHPSSHAGNQAGTTTNAASLVIPTNAPGTIELEGCGRGDDDDPRKPSKPYLKSTHDESDSATVSSDDSKEKRRKVAVRKGKRRMSDNSIPILDRYSSGEDIGDINDTYDPRRDTTLSDQAATADPSPSSKYPSSNTPEASQPGQIPSIIYLADDTMSSDNVTIGKETTANWLDDRLDTLRAASPPRAHIDENLRPRRHSVATPTNQQSANNAEPARLPTMLERHLESGHPREGTPYPSIALEGAGRQSSMPTLAEFDGKLMARVAPGVDRFLGPIDTIPIGRVSEASESPSRNAAIPGPSGRQRHSAERPLSCSAKHDLNDTTTEDHRGRSRLCGLSASCADVCEESQSRQGWRASGQVPASIITEEPPAHPLWVDEKRPKYYLSRHLDPTVGYGPCPNSPGASGSGVPFDLTHDKAPAAAEMVMTCSIPHGPRAAVSNAHTPASTDVEVDPDGITTEQYEEALLRDASVAATTNVPGPQLQEPPRYQLEDPPRYQLQDPLPPIYGDTQGMDGTQEALFGTLSQVALRTRGCDSGPDVRLSNTQVMDFALDPSMNSRDIALPPVARVPFTSDESWSLGVPYANAIDVEPVRRSSQTGPWARPTGMMNSETPSPSSPDSATLASQSNAIGPDVRTTPPTTGANTTGPESTTSEVMQQADRSSRRRASIFTTNSRRSIISYIFPCISSNDAETARSYSPERGRPREPKDFGSVSTTTDAARPSIYVPQRDRSPSSSPNPLPMASVAGDGNEGAHGASTDPGTSGPWLTP